MTHTRLLFLWLLIIIPFAAGSLSKKRLSSPETTAKLLIRISVTFIEPLIILWSMWGIDLHRGYSALPIGGLFLVVFGFAVGTIIARPARITGESRITFIISSSLANHGFTMGGIICFLFMGEKGLALSSIFLLYFMPYTFLFIFSYARISMRQEKSQSSRLKDFIFTYQNLPLLAIIIALVLHGAGIARPGVYFPFELMLMISMTLYYFTLGINFSLSDIQSRWREQALMAGIKFVILPLTAGALLYVLPLEKDVKNVLIIQSAMPAAIYSVIASILFNLDTKLASSIFVVNTILFLVLVLPLLFLLRGIIL